MKKIMLLLFICISIFNIGSTYATKSVSDFHLKLYQNGYIPSNPTNTLEQCKNAKTHYLSLNNQNISRSECFQLDLTSKYYYIICRNTNNCNKSEILNTIGYSEKLSSIISTYNTESSSDMIGGKCGSTLDLSKYTRLSEKIKGQLIKI